MPTPEYSPQSTTVSEVGVEGRGEHEGGGDEASPAAVSRCAGEQKRGESELCAPSGGEARAFSLVGCLASTAESSSSGGHSSSPVLSDGGSAVDANSLALRGTN